MPLEGDHHCVLAHAPAAVGHLVCHHRWLCPPGGRVDPERAQRDRLRCELEGGDTGRCPSPAHRFWVPAGASYRIGLFWSRRTSNFSIINDRLVKMTLHIYFKICYILFSVVPLTHVYILWRGAQINTCICICISVYTPYIQPHAHIIYICIYVDALYCTYHNSR